MRFRPNGNRFVNALFCVGVNDLDSLTTTYPLKIRMDMANRRLRGSAFSKRAMAKRSFGNLRVPTSHIFGFCAIYKETPSVFRMRFSKGSQSGAPPASFFQPRNFGHSCHHFQPQIRQSSYGKLNHVSDLVWPIGRWLVCENEIETSPPLPPQLTAVFFKYVAIPISPSIRKQAHQSRRGESRGGSYHLPSHPTGLYSSAKLLKFNTQLDYLAVMVILIEFPPNITALQKLSRLVILPTLTPEKHIFSDGFISIFFGSTHILDVVCPYSSVTQNIGRVTYLE